MKNKTDEESILDLILKAVQQLEELTAQVAELKKYTNQGIDPERYEKTFVNACRKQEAIKVLIENIVFHKEFPKPSKYKIDFNK